MSYILRNVTRGDLSLANTLNIRHNGCVTVEEVTEALRNEERKGIIRIESVDNISEQILEAREHIEAPELPNNKVNPESIPIVEPIIEPSSTVSISESIEEAVEEIEVPLEVEEAVEEIEVATNSPKSFNYNNRNDHNKSKFKK